MTDTFLKCFTNCVTDKEFIDEIKQDFYINAFKGCIIALYSESDSIEEYKRACTLTIARAFSSGCISSAEVMSLSKYVNEVIEEYRGKGV